LRFRRVEVARPRLPFRPRGFAPPRRFSPRSGCGFVAPRFRLWGPARCGKVSRPLRGGGEPSVPCAVVTLRRVPLISSRCASLRPSAFLPLPSVLPIRLPQRPSEEGARGRDCHWPSRVGRLQAGDRRGTEAGLCKQGSVSGAGSRLLAEAGIEESRRLPPRSSGRSWSCAVGVTARGRPKPIPRWRWPKPLPRG
jgi:hypothetical protein